MRGMCVDPWGLYVAIGIGKGTGDGGDGFINEVELFEIATGDNALAVPELKAGLNGTMVSAKFSWSSDGNSLVFVGPRGNVEMRQLPTFMIANMADLKKQMRMDEGFWHHFPMYGEKEKEVTKNNITVLR